MAARDVKSKPEDLPSPEGYEESVQVWRVWIEATFPRRDISANELLSLMGALTGFEFSFSSNNMTEGYSLATESFNIRISIFPKSNSLMRDECGVRVSIYSVNSTDRINRFELPMIVKDSKGNCHPLTNMYSDHSFYVGGLNDQEKYSIDFSTGITKPSSPGQGPATI